MKCPKCGSASTVYKTRKEKDGSAVVRKRVCQGKGCGHKWETEELRTQRVRVHI